MIHKDKVIHEIQVLAAQSGGTPPGQRRFASETGIKDHEWQRYWARWGDALIEAGFKPNEKTSAISEEELLEKLAMLARELGHFPAKREISLRSNKDPKFPSVTPFRKLGGQKLLMTRLFEYASSKAYNDVVEMCREIPAEKKIALAEPKISTGFVYLMKSGRYYKIGRTVSVGNRERQLAIKIPIPPKTIHSIETDDPVGIESYWHKRFEAKRGEGEWFDLSHEDVNAFKRWKRIV